MQIANPFDSRLLRLHFVKPSISASLLPSFPCIPVPLCCDDRLSNDIAELFTFIEQLTHSVFGEQFCLDNEANPAT